ncbi:glycosyltransferase family 4 protein [Pontibacter toksunensis]|uniref:Glycosyltransferase family 4 protein n=1 Tax=Pontibacter toksunensis TaxID=1332631 RepID=A0ABW6BQ73_9BACT
MKVLFISHEATRTGAPLFLLHLCKYLKQNTDLELYFLIKRDGPLSEEFANLGSTFIYQSSVSQSRNIVSRIRNRVVQLAIAKRLRSSIIINKLSRLKLDLIYSNTATNGALLHELAGLNIKVVTHVHELERVMQFFGVANLDFVKQYSSYYISASPSVTRYFEGVVKKKIFEISCFPIHTVPAETASSSLRETLGIPTNAFVVGSAGTVEWRKGWDLFIRLAKDLKQSDAERKVYFVWVGSISDRIKIDLQHELELAGLNHNVLFTGHKDNPIRYYAMFDVFCLMSREEAFGIVAIECALYGMPVICFDKAEGLASFIQDDAGFVIPYLDTNKMAEAIGLLKDNEVVRTGMGKVALKRVKDNYRLEEQGEAVRSFLASIR